MMPAWATSEYDGEFTPMENTMVTQDALDGSDGLFIENSMQFKDDMVKINDLARVFVGLGVCFALVSLFIYRRLLHKEGMRVDFNQSRRTAEETER